MSTTIRSNNDTTNHHRTSSSTSGTAQKAPVTKSQQPSRAEKSNSVKSEDRTKISAEAVSQGENGRDVGGIVGGLRGMAKEASKPAESGKGKMDGDIYKQIGGNQASINAFVDLTDAQKKQFMDLARSRYYADVEMTNPNFMKALGDGKLTQKDGFGKTTMDYLTLISKQKMADGLKNERILDNTIGNIADPTFIQQNNKGTCTATTLEYMHAKDQPADYARVVAGLTSEKGNALLQTGNIMERDSSGLQKDDSGRSHVDRIYQSSMMEYANGSLDYDNKTDQHTGQFTAPDGQVKQLTSPRSGMNAIEFNRAMNDTLGTHAEARFFDPRNTQAAEKDITSSLNRGESVPVGILWDKMKDNSYSGHELLVEKMKGDYVYLRNPWGDMERSNFGTDSSDTTPRRKTANNGPHPGGVVIMEKGDFYDRLQVYHTQRQSLLERFFGSR